MAGLDSITRAVSAMRAPTMAQRKALFRLLSKAIDLDNYGKVSDADGYSIQRWGSGVDKGMLARLVAMGLVTVSGGTITIPSETLGIYPEHVRYLRRKSLEREARRLRRYIDGCARNEARARKALAIVELRMAVAEPSGNPA